MTWLHIHRRLEILQPCLVHAEERRQRVESLFHEQTAVLLYAGVLVEERDVGVGSHQPVQVAATSAPLSPSLSSNDE